MGVLRGRPLPFFFLEMNVSLSQLAQTEAVLKALQDSIGDQLKQVKARLETELEASGVSRLDATLPDGTKVATISRSTPKATARVIDKDAFREWVRSVAPDEITSRLVTEVRPAYTAAVLAEMTAAGAPQWADRETGELHTVPGVEVQPTRSAGHSVRPVNGGREAVAEAWRSGALAHLDLLQLPSGGAE